MDPVSGALVEELLRYLAIQIDLHCESHQLPEGLEDEIRVMNQAAACSLPSE